MLDNSVLNVVISLTFIFLLYSLFATALQEALANLFQRMARMLFEGIKTMLSNTPDRRLPGIVLLIDKISFGLFSSRISKRYNQPKLLNSKPHISDQPIINSPSMPTIGKRLISRHEKRKNHLDGGYYENYGLTTGLDVFYYLRDSLHIDSKRLKIILIKNSNQEPIDSGHQVQLLAPLVGARQSPFTGHANSVLAEAKRDLADSNDIETIIFNAEAKKVPLTRSLTDRHIDSMETFIKYISNDEVYRNNLKRFIEH
jgi:hypothetical protein